jgi:hypothetical protein
VSAAIRAIPREIGRLANGGGFAKPTQLARLGLNDFRRWHRCGVALFGIKNVGASSSPRGLIRSDWRSLDPLDLEACFVAAKFPPDEYGFVVDPELARELRDSKLKLACLKLDKKRTPYAIAQEARTLHARIEEIRRSLQCPCPSRYGRKQLKSDNERLKIFGDWRVQKNLFPPEEDLEEARRTARLDSFLEGPELITRQRLANLRDKKRVADRGGPSQDS